MASIPRIASGASTQVKELAFSPKHGVDWSKYSIYRPIYPQSYFDMIYSYHINKLNSSMKTAHDVGSGSGRGILAFSHASSFDTVIVSDPNDGYISLARKTLVHEFGMQEDKFRFLKEKAEKSSVKAGSVNLVTLASVIHWTDAATTIRETWRQLSPGGTLAISQYAVPRIMGNERAQKAWAALWDVFMDKCHDDVYDRACWIVQSGYETLEFSEKKWNGVKRIYVNTQGSVASFKIAQKDPRVGINRVGPTEQKIWIENDEGWCDRKGFDFFKGYFGTYPPHIPDEEIRGLWDDFEAALGNQIVNIQYPLMLILATKWKGNVIGRGVRMVKEKLVSWRHALTERRL